MKLELTHYGKKGIYAYVCPISYESGKLKRGVYLNGKPIEEGDNRQRFYQKRSARVEIDLDKLEDGLHEVKQANGHKTEIYYCKVKAGEIVDSWDSLEELQDYLIEKRHGELPELVGSSKQIKWATDIRRDLIIRGLNASSLPDFALNKTVAKWWIDYRASIQKFDFEILEQLKQTDDGSAKWKFYQLALERKTELLNISKGWAYFCRNMYTTPVCEEDLKYKEMGEFCREVGIEAGGEIYEFWAQFTPTSYKRLVTEVVPRIERERDEQMKQDELDKEHLEAQMSWLQYEPVDDFDDYDPSPHGYFQIGLNQITAIGLKRGFGQKIPTENRKHEGDKQAKWYFPFSMLEELRSTGYPMIYERNAECLKSEYE